MKFSEETGNIVNNCSWWLGSKEGLCFKSQIRVRKLGWDSKDLKCFVGCFFLCILFSLAVLGIAPTALGMLRD